MALSTLNSIPASLAYKKIEDAIASLRHAPASKAAQAVISALCIARGRMQHLEQRLGETETMRDRIAMQLLPGTLADRDLKYSDELAIAYAYELADKVLAVREQGSAGALGETTSPEIPEFGLRFRAGERVRAKDTGASGVVVEPDPLSLADYPAPEYTWVSFRGTRPGTVCNTSNLERIGG